MGLRPHPRKRGRCLHLGHVINCGMANAGRAKTGPRLRRRRADQEAPRAPPPPPVPEEVEEELPEMVGPALPRLLAVDLGEKTVGVALYDEHGALLDFAAASDEEDGAQAVVAAAERCLGGRQATVVVCEGTGRMLADEAFDALSERGLVACEGPHVINPDEWRAAVLAPRERVNAKKAKHAARLVARQLAGYRTWRAVTWTTDVPGGAHAPLAAAWGQELGWRDDAIARFRSRTDLRVGRSGRTTSHVSRITMQNGSPAEPASLHPSGGTEPAATCL